MSNAKRALNGTLDAVQGTFSILWGLLAGPDRIPGCTLGKGECPAHVECDHCHPRPTVAGSIVTIGKVLEK